MVFRLEIKPVEVKEIVEAVQAMGDLKALGIDEFNATFFKATWDIVGADVCKTVQAFFEENTMNRAINCTLVTLIPKKTNAKMVRDMRPISCCTTVYKIISKILTARLGQVIGSVVDGSQSAFVPGRNIHDNIFMVQELLKGYGRKHISPRCMLQLDLQKAYDTVDWGALKVIMIEMAFPVKFVKWIMLAVSSVSYRYTINGVQTEILKARRGIRQGDPVSPFLFVLIMEYLRRKIMTLANIPDFNFHPRCEKMKILNICFADDLMLFTRGDEMSVQIIMDKFREFSVSTGLNANMEKCKIYFGGVNKEEQEKIINMTGFVRGKLPVKYLGVPIDSRKLPMGAYSELTDKIMCRIKHWSSKLLSYAGRVQLIRSVVAGITAYWLQFYPIPKGVLKQIEGMCRTFLWTGGEVKSKKAPIAWERVCDPKDSGGLRITDLGVWSKVFSAKLLWNLSTKADKLWVRWVHVYFMKWQTVEDYQPRANDSWILKKMLKKREEAFKSNTWTTLSVGDRFPSGRLYKEWRLQRVKVEWRKIFYGNKARPRALFVLWMACWGRLYTRDRMRRLGMNVESECLFCDKDETCEHLFFECGDSSRIWRRVLEWIKVDHRPGIWADELRWSMSRGCGNRSKGNVVKMLLTETVYHIWKRRNGEMHGRKMGVGETCAEIVKAVAVRCGVDPKLARVINSADVVDFFRD